MPPAACGHAGQRNLGRLDQGRDIGLHDKFDLGRVSRCKPCHRPAAPGVCDQKVGFDRADQRRHRGAIRDVDLVRRHASILQRLKRS